jgi:hypothetical protein
MSKIKYYPNPNRSNVVNSESYVPQYQLHGINPTPVRGFGGFAAGVNPLVKKEAPDLNNPRTRTVSMGAPYATEGSEDQDYVHDYEFYEQTNRMPNVGNIDNSWNFTRETSYDVMSDVGVDEEFSEVEPLPDLIDDLESEDVINAESEYLENISKESYVLIFGESILHVGTLSSVEPIIESLLNGEHELCAGKRASVDDIILLKRVNVNYGLFFEE